MKKQKLDEFPSRAAGLGSVRVHLTRGARRRSARRRSALKRRVEAASAVDGFGAGRLRSLPAELVSTQTAAEPRTRRLVLLIEGSCGGERTALAASCLHAKLTR